MSLVILCVHGVYRLFVFCCGTLMTTHERIPRGTQIRGEIYFPEIRHYLYNVRFRRRVVQLFYLKKTVTSR